MNVVINLLPDIRLAKQRERGRRQLATGIALIIWAVCAGVVVILSLSTASQQLLIKDANSKINAKIQKLNEMTGLLTALTAQEHLTSLTGTNGLYSNRVYFSKFYNAYSIAAPTDLTLSTLGVSGIDGTVTATGSAKTYASVAKLAKALEAENITLGASASSSNTPYFTNVQINSASSSAGNVGFTISALVDKEVTNGHN